MTLPDELLDAIFTLLGVTEQKVARLACKTFAGIIEPHLFSSLVIDTYSIKIDASLQLIQTLSTGSRSFSRFTHKVTIGIYVDYAPWRFGWRPVVPTRNVLERQLPRALSRLNHVTTVRWKLHSSPVLDPFEIITSWLMSCTSLTELIIDRDLVPFPKHPSLFVSSPVRFDIKEDPWLPLVAHVAPNLQSLEINLRNTFLNFTHTTLMGDKFPSLEHISRFKLTGYHIVIRPSLFGTALQSFTVDALLWDITEHFITQGIWLEELRVKEGNGCLTRYLQHYATLAPPSRSLKRLEVTVQTFTTNRPNVIYNALKGHSETLEDLSVVAIERPDVNWESNAGVIAGCCNLRRLRVSLGCPSHAAEDTVLRTNILLRTISKLPHLRTLKIESVASDPYDIRRTILVFDEQEHFEQYHPMLCIQLRASGVGLEMGSFILHRRSNNGHLLFVPRKALPTYNTLVKDVNNI